MRDNSVLSQFAAKVGVPPARNDETPDELADDYGAFSILRGVRDRSLMLEFRLKNGNVVALGYGWLERIEFDPSEGITLTFTGQKVVKIIGRNLNAEVRPQVRLLDGLIRHRVPWIAEADEPTAFGAARTVTIIERIALD